jgi:hypothetical protein
MLVKSIVTLPALALSALLSNFSWPSGLAATASVLLAPDPSLLAGADALVLVVAALVLLGGDVEVLEVLELPQPVSANATTTSAGVRSFERWGLLAVLWRGLTGRILHA